jgi:hypothetical protein
MLIMCLSRTFRVCRASHRVLLAQVARAISRVSIASVARAVRTRCRSMFARIASCPREIRRFAYFGSGQLISCLGNH